MATPYTYITSAKQLETCCQEIRNYDVLAVDLECENNIHHYGTFICLIQLSTKDTNYLVDVLAFDDFSPLVAIFEDDSILKIFHDINFDVRILHFEYGCKVKNFFDTQLAAQLLGVHQPSLASLLEEYYGVEKQSKFQRADWTTRPLSEEMCAYGVGDTSYLIRLYEELSRQLTEKDRMNWMKEECAYLESLELDYKEYTYEDFKGYGLFNKTQQAILKNLFLLRDDLAKKKGIPPHFIINNSGLTDLVVAPPQTIAGWKKLKGVHPLVKRKADVFLRAVKEVTLDKSKKKVVHKRFNEDQKKQLIDLTDKVTKIAKKVGIARHLIMNKDQIRQVVVDQNYDSLRNWQKVVLGVE